MPIAGYVTEELKSFTFNIFNQSTNWLAPFIAGTETVRTNYDCRTSTTTYWTINDRFTTITTKTQEVSSSQYEKKTSNVQTLSLVDRKLI